MPSTRLRLKLAKLEALRLQENPLDPEAEATGRLPRMSMHLKEELLIIQRLHKVLRPFLLRRTKEQVLTEAHLSGSHFGTHEGLPSAHASMNVIPQTPAARANWGWAELHPCTAKDLPPKTEAVIWVPLSSWQKAWNCSDCIAQGSGEQLLCAHALTLGLVNMRRCYIGRASAQFSVLQAITKSQMF